MNNEDFIHECIENLQNNNYKLCINILYDNIKYIKKILDDGIGNEDFILRKTEKKNETIKLLNESTEIIKLFYLVTYLITCVYETYYDDINGNKIYVNKKIDIINELANHNKNKTYMIIFAVDNDIIKLFILFLIICEYKTKISKINYVGIDYEFKKGNVAMMQMNFEINIVKKLNYIWIIDPNELDSSMTLELINNLMINKKIYKIFQGADSRDFEYIYPFLFQKNKKLFIKFLKKVIDTRFLCEYIRACKNEIDIKSSIYYSLKYFDVITDDKYTELHSVENGMGPPQDVDWNIHKLSQDQKKYAFYDVIYLKYLIKAMYRKINNEFPQYLNSLNYVNKISRFAFGESDKLQITIIRLEIEKIINPLNINYVKIKNENIKLNDISKFVMKDIKIELPQIKNKNQYIQLDHLFRVPYFKKCLHAIFTLIVYSIVYDNYTIYKNKKDIIGDVITSKNISIDISKIYGRTLLILFNNFEKEARNKILLSYVK